MTRTGLGLFLAINLSFAVGCATDPLDAAIPDGTGQGAQAILGTGNPFTYSSARDQQLACFGIAFTPNFPSNCNDIVDSDDRAMCRGMSTHTQAPCLDIVDRNLELTCLAMAPGPWSQSQFCNSITDPEMQKFCNAYNFLNSAICNGLVDSNTREECLQIVSGSSSVGNGFCGLITNPNDALFCEGVSNHTQTPCFSIQ